MSGELFEQAPNFNCYAPFMKEPIEELFGSWSSPEEVTDLIKSIQQLDLESRRILTGEDLIFQTVALEKNDEISDPSGLVDDIMKLLISANESTNAAEIYQFLDPHRLLRSRIKLTHPRIFISH